MPTEHELLFDLHLHSPFSQAVSKFMTLSEMSRQATLKGIDVLTTGDWTHPAWFATLQEELIEVAVGVYSLKAPPDFAGISRELPAQPTRFVLVTEISCIFSQGGKLRRVHLLVAAPSISVVARINAALLKRGAKLGSDGRPVIGISCHDLAELVFTVDEKTMVIPAHAWTPWFGIYGSKGGFDSLAEAFGELAAQIFAVETGLSSDPAMNWRIPELDSRAIVSFSDAHSPAKLGREVTVFTTKQETFSYAHVYAALATPTAQNSLTLSHTIEFYPEEGKYHWDGHRACDVVQAPAITKQNGTTCPVCGKPLTVGVEYRVEELAKREVSIRTNPLQTGVVQKSFEARKPFASLVPLQEVIAEVLHKKVSAKAVQETYAHLTKTVASEFDILLNLSPETLYEKLDAKLAEGIMKVRRGELSIKPGFDGVYGEVTLQLSDTAEAGLF